MPSVRGDGDSLGGAFRDALAGLSTGAARVSYTRKGWQAQFKQLYGTTRGYEVLSQSLNVRQQKTIEKWLKGESAPTAANQAKIREAYGRMREGGLPGWVKSGKMAVSGEVAAGGDVRDRGSGHSAPLNVDLGNGNWARVEPALTDDRYDANELGELIAEGLIAEDIGDVSGGWGFPGGSYSVTISG